MVPSETASHVSEPPARAPLRSVRRATARRASSRRANARIRKSDIDSCIVDFLGNHPGSTTGDIAKSLNLEPEHVAASLIHLMSAGDIDRSAHGYNRQPPD